MKFIIKLLINALAVFMISFLLAGVEISSYSTAIVVAVVLSLLNILVKPLLILFTLPITIITLGVFLLFVNAFIILLADQLVSGFSVSSIWWAIVFSISLSLLQPILNSFVEETKK